MKINMHRQLSKTAAQRKESDTSRSGQFMAYPKHPFSKWEKGTAYPDITLLPKTSRRITNLSSDELLPAILRILTTQGVTWNRYQQFCLIVLSREFRCFWMCKLKQKNIMPDCFLLLALIQKLLLNQSDLASEKEESGFFKMPALRTGSNEAITIESSETSKPPLQAIIYMALTSQTKRWLWRNASSVCRCRFDIYPSINEERGLERAENSLKYLHSKSVITIIIHNCWWRCSKLTLLLSVL